MKQFPVRKQIEQLRQKLTWTTHPLVLEMLNDARRGMTTDKMIYMYSNQLAHLEKQLKEMSPVIQRDLEDQIREELENE